MPLLEGWVVVTDGGRATLNWGRGLIALRPELAVADVVLGIVRNALWLTVYCDVVTIVVRADVLDNDVKFLMDGVVTLVGDLLDKVGVLTHQFADVGEVDFCCYEHIKLNF